MQYVKIFLCGKTSLVGVANLLQSKTFQKRKTKPQHLLEIHLNLDRLPRVVKMESLLSQDNLFLDLSFCASEFACRFLYKKGIQHSLNLSEIKQNIIMVQIQTCHTICAFLEKQ